LDKPKIEKGGIGHCPDPHVINWNESSAKPQAGGQLAHLQKFPLLDEIMWENKELKSMSDHI